MSRLRALLLGVAEYDDENIPPLPCVPGDLQDMRRALVAHGYSVELPNEDGRMPRATLLGAVHKFLLSGEVGDTLLVYLSGHGVHSDGEDYLLPGDALRDLSMRDIAVSLRSWNSAIDRSGVSQIVFFIDSCREGIYETTMSVATHAPWDPGSVGRAGRCRVAWIFPCAPGQVSRYVRGDGDRVPRPFSLFARAVQDVLNDPFAPIHLAEFKRYLRSAMDRLARKHGQPAQEIRVVTNGLGDEEQFVLFPTEESGPRRWQQAAASHPAWSDAASTTQSAGLHGRVLILIQKLAVCRQLAGAASGPDPWTEAGAFALRMTERMSLLLGLLQPDLTLTQAEAALLVTAPFLIDAYEATETARAAVESPPGDDQAWWELRQAAVAPSAVQADRVAELLGAKARVGTFDGEVFAPPRIAALLRAVRADNAAFAPQGTLGLATHIVIASGRPGEQELREWLVGALVTVAHRLTIDSRSLLGDYGDFGQVAPASLRATLAEATWDRYGRGRSLSAACSHPAVERGLRAHAALLNDLLAHLDEQALSTDLRQLRNLPVRVVAFGVRPAVTDGFPAYDIAAYPGPWATRDSRDQCTVALPSSPSRPQASAEGLLSDEIRESVGPDPAALMAALLALSADDCDAWLAGHAADVGAVVSSLADSWGDAEQERHVLEALLRLLPGSVPAESLRSALSCHGYLAERVTTLYPRIGDERLRVLALRSLVTAAWHDQGFGRKAVDDVLRKCREPVPLALHDVVLSLADDPAQPELAAYARRQVYVSRQQAPSAR